MERARFARQQINRAVGQAHTEIAIVLILIGLATVVFFSFFGRTVGRAFYCAGQAIARGNGLTFSCPGSESTGDGEQKPGQTIVASGGPAPLPENVGGGPSSAGGGPRKTGSGASSAATEGKSGEAAVGTGEVPTLPDLGDGLPSAAGPGAPSVSGGGSQQSQGGVTGGGGGAKPGPGVLGADVPSLGGGASSAPGSARQQPQSQASGGGGGPEPKSGEVDLGSSLPALPEPSGGSSSGGAQQGVSGEAATGNAQGRAEPVEVAGKGPALAAPSGGSGSASGGTAQQRLNEAKELLKSTAKGRDLLKYLDDHGVAIELRSGDGSEYDPGTGKIFMNDAKSAEQMVLTVAHEGNHAEFDKSGKSANVNTDSRDDYVRKMIEEEALGTVASIEMKKDLQAAGKTITATYPLESEYDAAYKKAVDDLKKSKPSASAAELDAAGKAAGLDAVRNGFKTGKVVASNTTPPVTYPDYYGKAYDDNQAAKARRSAAPEPMSIGPKTDKERRAIMDFLALQTIDDARDLIMKGSSSGRPIPTELVRQDAVIELRGVDGGSTKQFEIEHPFKETDRGPCGPGQIYGCGIIRDYLQNEVVFNEIPAGSKANPNVPKIVVDGRTSAGDIAFAVFQENARLKRLREDPDTLDKATARLDVDKARQEFVNRMVEEVASRNADQILEKRRLQRLGATVTKPLLLENEFNAAYNKTLNEQLPKVGIAKADELAVKAGVQALRDAVARGAVVSVTPENPNEKFADFFGRQFDKKLEEKIAKDPTLPQRIAASAVEAKRRAGIDALAELVNKVNPNSPDADNVIRLVDALLPSMSEAEKIIFITQANAGLTKLLGPFGFRTVFGTNIAGLQRDRLEYALGTYANLSEEDRKAIRDDPTGFTAQDKGIVLKRTKAEADAEGRLVYAQELSDGSYFVGTKAERSDAEERIRVQRILAQLEGIKNAGPGALVGRIIGCVAEGASAFDPCGEKGAAIGGLVDTGLQVYGVVKGRANVKKQIANYESSGGHAVYGDRGGADYEPVSGPRLTKADRSMPRPDAPDKPYVAPKSLTETKMEPAKQPEPPKPPNAPGSSGSQKATIRGTGVQPPRVPADGQQATQQGVGVRPRPPARAANNAPADQKKTGNPPVQNGAGQATGVGGNDTGMDAGRAQKRVDQRAADARRAKEAEQQAARAARDAWRQRDLAKRAADANAALERQATNLPKDNENISADEAIRRAENGDFSLVISMNGRRHQEAYEEKILAQQLERHEPIDISKAPPVRNVFTDGKMVRINFEALTDAQKARVEKLANPSSSGGPGGGGSVDPQGNTLPQVDPRANTQRRTAQLDFGTQVGHAPGPQPPGNGGPPKPPPPAGAGQPSKTGAGVGNEGTQPVSPPKSGSTSGGQDTAKLESATVPGQQSGRPERNTSEITRPGASDGAAGEKTGKFTQPGAAARAGGKTAKPDPGPGKFAPEDVAFGISRPDGKTDALANFAGQAKDGGKIQITEGTRNPAPGAPESVVNAAVAKETVAEAKVYLRASGGQLRFSLEGFNVNDALDSTSANFNKVTSHEFRTILRDPFFRGRVRFYDPARRSPGNPSGDVTDEIFKLPVSK